MSHQTIEAKPSLAGISYSSTTDTDWPLANPVVSIVQLIFHPNVDVNDQKQPVATLWRSSLEYVSTIPGFQTLHWAPVKQSPTQCLILLIQWDSGLAWKRFQCSLGFSMLLGYLSPGQFNRCLQLELPADMINSDCNLEIASFQFSYNETSPSKAEIRESEEKFSAQWGSICHEVMSSGDDHVRLIASCGDWIEKDYKTESQFFTGLLFWKLTANQVDSPQRLLEGNINNISSKIMALSQEAGSVVSTITNQLNHESSHTLRPQKSVSSTQVNYQHPILNTPVTRQCDVKSTERQGHSQDPIHVESVKQTKSRQRVCPGPAGNWCPMGNVSQHGLPVLGGSDKRMLEIVMFDLQTTDSYAMRLFQELRIELWKLGDCPLLRWGIDRNNTGCYSSVYLLIGMCPSLICFTISVMGE